MDISYPTVGWSDVCITPTSKMSNWRVCPSQCRYLCPPYAFFALSSFSHCSRGSTCSPPLLPSVGFRRASFLPAHPLAYLVSVSLTFVPLPSFFSFFNVIVSLSFLCLRCDRVCLLSVTSLLLNGCSLALSLLENRPSFGSFQRIDDAQGTNTININNKK